MNPIYGNLLPLVMQYAIPGEPLGCSGIADIAVMQQQCNMQYQVNPINGFAGKYKLHPEKALRARK